MRTDPQTEAARTLGDAIQAYVGLLTPDVYGRVAMPHFAALADLLDTQVVPAVPAATDPDDLPITHRHGGNR